MVEHYLWLTPAAVLAVLLLFRFVACTSFVGVDDVNYSLPYPDSIKADKPVAYWRLQENDQSGVGAAFKLVGHSKAASNGSAGGTAAAVTPAINTSGATLLVVTVVDSNHDSTTDTVTDSFGNSWNHLGNSKGAGATNAAIWYAFDHGGSPLSVGPGHTVTVAGKFCSIELTAWSGSKPSANPLDQQNTGAAHATTAQPGSITPSVPGCLVVTAAGYAAPGTYTIDSGYTVSDQNNFVSSVAMGSAQAHLIQEAAAATNPTWKTSGAATQIACAIAAFQPHATTLKAKNEIAGAKDGDLFEVSAPLPAGDPNWRSTAVNTAVLTVGVTDPPPIDGANTSVTSYRLNGGYVRVSISNPPEFSVDLLVLPEFQIFPPDGSFHCVLESSAPGTTGPGAQKKEGFAIYAGPDDPADPASKMTWQVWVGDGTGFKRLGLKDPLAPGDPGLAVMAAPTYLALTYSNSNAFLHIYFAKRDFDFLKYELVHVNYVSGGIQDLFIGITGPRRALFTPFPGPNPGLSGFLYPFNGRIAEVAIYDKVLTSDHLAAHGNAAFKE